MGTCAQLIKSDIDSFQANVQKLSISVQSASPLWRDPKYSELVSGISAIAMQSRDVLVVGDKLCDSIDRFFEISEERY